MPVESLYKKLSVRLPPLYEQLILNYRWADVDLQLFCLHLGEGFTGLFKRISKDAHLWKQLVAAGYIPFGKGTDIDYDPIVLN